MYYRFIKQKLLSTQIWKLIISVLMLSYMYYCIFSISHRYVDINNFWLIYISRNEVFDSFIFGIPIVLVMSDIYNGNKSIYENFMLIRMKKRSSAAAAYIIYSFVMSIIVILIIVLSNLIGFFIAKGFEPGALSLGNTPLSIYSFIQRERLPKESQLDLLSAVSVKLSLNYLYCVWIALSIIMINMWQKRNSLGYIFFFAQTVLTLLIYAIFKNFAAIYIFPLAHVGLGKLPLTIPGYIEMNIEEFHRIPYFVSYIYFFISIIFFSNFIVWTASKKDFMVQEGLIR